MCSTDSIFLSLFGLNKTLPCSWYCGNVYYFLHDHWWTLVCCWYFLLPSICYKIQNIHMIIIMKHSNSLAVISLTCSLNYPWWKKCSKHTCFYRFELLVFSVPDKRRVSDQKPEEAGHLTQQNKWQTWVGAPSTTSIDPSIRLVDTQPLKLSGALVLYLAIFNFFYS